MSIDTLAYVKRLEAAGISRPHAEAHAEAIGREVFPQLATRADLEQAKHELKVEIAAVRSELVTTKADLTMRVFGIVGGFCAILFPLLKLT